MTPPGQFDADEWSSPEEFPTSLYVNGHLVVTVQSTRIALTEWAFGYLFGQGLIRRPGEVAGLAIDHDRAIIHAYIAQSARPDGPAPVPGSVDSPAQTSHSQLARFQARMQEAAVLYAATGGMHVAGLFRLSDGAMIAREDIGRHNTVDKVIGAALLEGWDPRDLVLLTSGRIAHEMARKAALFGISIVASRSAVTDQAARLGERLGMALIGYLRPHGLRVYTGQERLVETLLDAGAQHTAPVSRLQTIYGE